MLRPGMFLQNRYEILELIGSGGMSDVYKAKCHKLNRLVAIKVLKLEFRGDKNFIEKFKMEAQAAARLSHPNIVSVYDVVDEEPLHYIVMELIEGITLKNYIAKKGKLEIKEAIGIAIQVSQGIAAAHEQRIIHRDIKPQNMIISRDGKVKVADFGIARAATAQTINATAMGSVHYISPEQARGGYSDARSDIYSLGITMYEMVTGRVPFEGDNTVTIALAHLEEPITKPSVYNPEIPVGFEQIILKCTEKKPERRYNNVPEVISDLRKVLLHPTEQVVHHSPVKDQSETIVIGAKELEMIQRGQSKTVSQMPSEHRTAREDRAVREEAANLRSSGTAKKREVQDDVNPQIERIMTGIGVVVAIVIVAVVIFLFTRLSGIFNAGAGKEPTITATPVETETQLDDTQVRMPDVKDLPLDMAEAKMKESSLVLRVSSYEDSDTVEKGSVIRQEIEPDTVVAKYSTVNVVVSNGSGKIELEYYAMIDMNAAAAQSILESKKLKVTLIPEPHDTIEAGNVIRYEPSVVKEGDTVKLYVSEGPETQLKAVPDIVDTEEEAGRQNLEKAGFTVGEVTHEYSDEYETGMISSQSEAAGTELPEGTAISFVVSDGPEPSSKRYLASISETYNLGSLIGPGAMNSSVTVMIRLEQIVNGTPVHKVLMEPRELVGQTQLPVNFPVIEGASGVETGEVQIIDVDSGAVIKSYPVTFFPME